MKLLLTGVALLSLACIAATLESWPTETNSKPTAWLLDVGKPYQRPTNSFEWMPALVTNDWKPGDPPAYRDDPEWQPIRFGHNHVGWLSFRRGKYGWNWNGWEPVPATELNAVILQSSFEPVVTRTNGVWLITFKR